MLRCGLVLTLLAATVAVFGAEPEKSDKAVPAKSEAAPAKNEAAPAKNEAAPAKNEAAPVKSEKTAPEAKAKKAVIGSPIPWLIPAGARELKNDDLIDVPAEGIRTRVEMADGDKLAFKLVDVSSTDPGKWEVCAVNSAVAKVEAVGKDEGGWFSKPTITFEISAVNPGRTLLELGLKDHRGAPIRMFRCYIEVK